MNTAVTYLAYLGLSQLLNYQLAFLLAYATGIVFSYFFNAKIVFRAALSWSALMAYPAVYLIQYIVSASALGFFVGQLGMSTLVAPLTVAIATLPLTYVLSKFLIVRNLVTKSVEESKSPDIR